MALEVADIYRIFGAKTRLANTFLGNVGGTLINDKSDVASLTTLNSDQITRFVIIGNNVIFRAEVDFTFISRAFENENITYAINTDGKLKEIRIGVFLGTQKMFSFAHYGVGLSGDGSINSGTYQNSSLKHIFTEFAKELARISTFVNIKNARIYAPIVDDISQVGSSAASPFIGNENVKIYIDQNAPSTVINYINSRSGLEAVLITDYTTPNAVTDLNAIDVGGTYVELDFTEILEADFYEIWMYLNDEKVWRSIGEIQPNERYIVNLQQSTNYQLKIATCDQYWNGSGFFLDKSKRAFSNIINVTTTTTPALFQNAVAYYKLDETSGNAIDVVNGYNGTLFGGVTQGVDGKFGTAYSFDGSGFVNLGQPSDLNLLPQSTWTIRVWMKTTSLNGSIISKGDFGNRQYHLWFANGFITANIGGSGANNTEVSVNDGNWNHVVLVNNSGTYSFYVNGVKTNDDYIAGSTTINVDTLIGARRASGNTGSGFLYDGDMDEVTIIKDEAWDIAKISEDYNNGNGTTI